MTFTNAPVTRLTVLGLVSTSIAASLFDAKHYFYIFIDTHLFRYRQFWRLLAYQLCYTNSTEVLFAAISLYNLRAIERMWGSRKYAVSASSPIVVCYSGLASTDMNTIVIPRHLIAPHGHIPATHPHRAPTPSTGLIQLYAGWAHAHHLCDSGPIPCHGSANVQVPYSDVSSATYKRAVLRRHAIGQVVPVCHCLSPGSAAVAGLCHWSCGRLGRWILLESRAVAHLIHHMEAPWLDGGFWILQEKRRVRRVEKKIRRGNSINGCGHWRPKPSRRAGRSTAHHGPADYGPVSRSFMMFEKPITARFSLIRLPLPRPWILR